MITRVLSAGPLSWLQGYEWALQAIRVAIDSGAACEYRIVGKGEHLDALCFARHELGLVANVELRLEHAEPEELRRHLKWADVYLDAAVARGANGVAAQALKMGVPVVATDRTRLPEAADAIVVPRRDPAAMGAAIARLARPGYTPFASATSAASSSMVTSRPRSLTRSSRPR